MDTNDPSNLPRPRVKRSYTALPKFHGLKDATFSPIEAAKKHTKNRHSLHHPHFPGHGHGRQARGDWLVEQEALSRQQTRVGNANGVGQQGTEDGNAENVEAADAEGTTAAVVPVLSIEQLAVLQKRQYAHEEELRSTLSNLSTLSMATTRRLDDIYYSILEKASQLQETVTALQELSNHSKHFHAEFTTDIEDLEKDIEGQVKGFRDFSEAGKRIEDLEVRITRSKEKAWGLNGRLEGARRKVRDLEVMEGEYQANITKRYIMFWGTLGGVVVLLFSILIWGRSRNKNGGLVIDERGQRVPASADAQNLTVDLPILASVASVLEAVSSKAMPILSSMLPARTESDGTDDPRLQMLRDL